MDHSLIERVQILRRKLEGPGSAEFWWDPACGRAPAVIVLIGFSPEGFMGVAVPVESINAIVEAMLGVVPVTVEGCLGRVVVTPNLGSVDIRLERDRRTEAKQVEAGRLGKTDARAFAADIRSLVGPMPVMEADGYT